jgi:hypothetical protein
VPPQYSSLNNFFKCKEIVDQSIELSGSDNLLKNKIQIMYLLYSSYSKLKTETDVSHIKPSNFFINLSLIVYSLSCRCILMCFTLPGSDASDTEEKKLQTLPNQVLT